MEYLICTRCETIYNIIKIKATSMDEYPKKKILERNECYLCAGFLYIGKPPNNKYSYHSYNINDKVINLLENVKKEVKMNIEEVKKLIQTNKKEMLGDTLDFLQARDEEMENFIQTNKKEMLKDVIDFMIAREEELKKSNNNSSI